jgi:hypothetical protein
MTIIFISCLLMSIHCIDTFVKGWIMFSKGHVNYNSGNQAVAVLITLICWGAFYYCSHN